MDIKIFKAGYFLYFLKNNYLIAIIIEAKSEIAFFEYNLHEKIIPKIENKKYIDLYDFIFSGTADRIFVNRTKPLRFRTEDTEDSLKTYKELKEYFEEIVACDKT